MSSRRVYKEVEGYKAEDLLQSAYDHFLAAKTLFGESADLFDSAGYLTHLSLELLFKSWLLEINKEFPETHSLQHLRELIISIDPTFKLSKEQNRVVEHLDKLYLLRYPNHSNPTEIGNEDFALAESVGNKIVSRLPDSLYEKFENVGFGRKGGRVLMQKPSNGKVDIDFITGKNKT